MHEQQPANESGGDVQVAAAEQPSTLRPRIWVGSLADYNAGVLHGRWIDAARDPDEILDDVTWMLVSSPTNPRAEEWGIFDGADFAGLSLDEYESVETVSRLARGLVMHGAAFAAWAELAGREAEALDRFETAFLGRFDSVAAYAEHLCDDLGYTRLLDQTIPDSIRLYVHIDTEALGRDLVLGGDIAAHETPDGGVWLFDPRP